MFLCSGADVDGMLSVESLIFVYVLHTKRWCDAKRLMSRRGRSSLSFSIVGSAMRCMQGLRSTEETVLLMFHYLVGHVAVSGSQKVLCALVCCSVGSVCCPQT